MFKTMLSMNIEQGKLVREEDRCSHLTIRTVSLSSMRTDVVMPNFDSLAT